ncbi:MAG: hypothetical protein WCJ31_07480 [Planctomycetia bacterium]
MRGLLSIGNFLAVLSFLGLFLCPASTAPAMEVAGCLADPAWFQPAGPDPVDPDIPLPPNTDECAFYKVAWQTFLHITHPSDNGNPRFLSFTAPVDLFQNRAATDLVSKDRRKGSLFLLPRSTKSSGTRTVDGVLQAVSDGVLVDQAGRAVYTSTHLNDVFVQFVKAQGYDQDVSKIGTAEMNGVLAVEKGSLELKATWKILDPLRDDARTFFTIEEDVPALAVEVDPTTHIQKIVLDLKSPPRHQTLALVGLHVVLTVKDHPEFIWASFEHVRNAPGLVGQKVADDTAVDGFQDYTFYTAGTKRSDCNKNPKPDDAMNPLTLDATTQTLSPVTQVYRQFKYGSPDNQMTNINEPDPDVTSLNRDVRTRLAAANSVWQNYFLLGAVWIDDPANQFEVNAGLFKDNVLKGETRLSNSTIETFSQPEVGMPSIPARPNCFRCHATASEAMSVNGTMLTLPAQRINVSHVLKNAFFRR